MFVIAEAFQLITLQDVSGFWWNSTAKDLIVLLPAGGLAFRHCTVWGLVVLTLAILHDEVCGACCQVRGGPSRVSWDATKSPSQC